MTPSGRLSSIDLNLLTALDALLTERSVTRAGRRIGLSQSSTSHSLKRLRALFDDPLLVRVGNEMRPTPLGNTLTPRVRELLDGVHGLLGCGRFDPTTDDRTFVVGASDYVGLALLPSLLQLVAAEAPRVRLRVRALSGPLVESALADGELDVAVDTFFGDPGELRREELFRDGYVCAVRRGLPGVGRRLSVEQYAALPHVLIASPGEGPGPVDYALAARGLARTVVLYVPHFAAAPAVVAVNDYVVTLPVRAARALKRPPLRLMAPPVELKSFATSMQWHARSDVDPGCRWLREVLVRAGAGLSPLPSS